VVTAGEVITLGARDLRGLLAEGHPIDPAALDDTEYRGTSLGLPALVDRLAWKTFRKVFHRDGGGLRGWNVRVDQRGPGAPFAATTRGGRPVTFGDFVVAPPDARTPAHARRGLLLDYGAAHAAAGPLRLLRDPLVALVPGSAALLLGWSYLDLAFGVVGTPSFFLLERDGRLSHRRP
jgi:hypothetical protein